MHEEQVLEESDIGVDRLAVGVKALGCRGYVEDLGGPPGEAFQQGSQHLPLSDAGELDCVALHRQAHVVVEPSGSGGTAAAQREGKAAGAHPGDVVIAGGGRCRVSGYRRVGIAHQRAEQILAGAANLALGQGEDRQRVEAARQRFSRGGHGVLPSGPGEHSGPRYPAVTVQAGLQRTQKLRGLLVLVDAHRRRAA